MQEQFVTYDIAVTLKEKGYTDECMASYECALTSQRDNQNGYSGSFGWKKGECNFTKEYFYNGCLKDISNKNWIQVAAPLWQQVIDWLRNKHNLRVFEDTHKSAQASYSWNDNFRFEVVRISGNGGHANSAYGSGGLGSSYETYKTYQEARKVAIEKALTLI